jgi:hypothetical protein
MRVNDPLIFFLIIKKQTLGELQGNGANGFDEIENETGVN